MTISLALKVDTTAALFMNKYTLLLATSQLKAPMVKMCFDSGTPHWCQTQDVNKVFQQLNTRDSAMK